MCDFTHQVTQFSEDPQGKIVHLVEESERMQYKECQAVHGH
jgi:hypothetical protein